MALRIPKGVLGDLIRVPIDYVLEAWVDGVLEQAVCLPNTPSGIRITRQGSDKAFTLSSAVVEWSELRHTLITMEGRSGTQARSGHDRNGALIYLPGPEILEEFDQFLIGIHKTFKEKQAKGLKCELIFRSYPLKIHVKCTVEQWSPAKAAASSRHSYEWSLTLWCYGSAQADTPSSILAPLDEWAKTATDAINDVNAYGAAATNALGNTRKDLDALREPLRALQRSATLAQEAVSGVRDIVSFPADVLRDVVRTAAGLARAAQDAIDLKDFVLDGAGIPQEVEAFRSVLGLADASVGASEPALGVLGQASSVGEVSPVSSGPRSTRPARFPTTPRETARLKMGEDLRGFSTRILGDPDRWREVAWINGWRGVDRRSDGSPPVGDTLIVPSDREESLDQIWTDIAFKDGDLVLDLSTGDFETVKGADSAIQALTNRCTINQGDWILFDALGLPGRIGDPSPKDAGLYGTQILELLKRDPRVVEVSRLSVEISGSTVDVMADIELIDGSSKALTVPLKG